MAGSGGGTIKEQYNSSSLVCGAPRVDRMHTSYDAACVLHTLPNARLGGRWWTRSNRGSIVYQQSWLSTSNRGSSTAIPIAGGRKSSPDLRAARSLIYVYMYIYICIYYNDIYICNNIYISYINNMYVCVCEYVYMHVYVFFYTHTNIFIYIYIYIYTYIY
jgi:hypothetical protein